MKNDNMKVYCNKIINGILEKQIKNSAELETRKIELAKELGIGNIPRNADIILRLHEFNLNRHELERMRKFLRTKPVRTGSGVANIAVMWAGECDGKCIYCPSVSGIPKSYTGREPAAMRAQRNDFDCRRQIANRFKQLGAIGHIADKCELIIMGGNFLIQSVKERDKFMKACLEEFEKHGARIIGLTFETRPDFCTRENIQWMLSAGATRVEIGVQSTDDNILKKVKRGHTNKDTIEAIARLKNAGLKVCIHWMPGLTGITGRINLEKEIADFKKLFTPAYEPDELKIYPVLVIPGTGLYEMWKKGEYDALTNEQTMELLMKLKQLVPEYVRIKRVMRDIPEQLVEHGPCTTNLRQLVHEKMAGKGLKCRCIRCREIRSATLDKKQIKLDKIEYKASGGREIFLQFTADDKIIGFLRLRLALNKSKRAMVRELHVYGPMIPTGQKSNEKQHKGYGQRLLREAENIAKQTGYNAVQITSGIGVREYYRKLGYQLKGYYMTKHLH